MDHASLAWSMSRHKAPMSVPRLRTELSRRFATGGQRTAIWSAATCRRFVFPRHVAESESGLVRPHSKIPSFDFTNMLVESHPQSAE